MGDEVLSNKKLTKTMFALFAVGLGALDELLLEYVMAFVDTGCRDPFCTCT